MSASRLRPIIMEGWVLALALCSFGVAAADGLAVRSPLGHDEAVYMLRGRELLEGGWAITYGNYWHDYRAPGLPLLIASLGQIIGVHVTSSRMIVVLLGALSIVLTWYLVRKLVGRVAADLSAALLAVTGGFVLTSTTLLADVPGAVFSMVTVAMYAHELAHGRLRWSFPLVPIFTFTATTARFGAPFMIAAGLLGVSIIAIPRVARERDWMLVAQASMLGLATGLTCVLVVMTQLLALGGQSPASANRELIDRNELSYSTGLRDLRNVLEPSTELGAHMWSPVVAMVFAVGIACAVLGALFRRLDGWTVTGLAVAACLSLAAIVASVGLIVPNYLALTIPYWAALAGVGLSWPVKAAWAAVTGRTLRAVAGVIVVALCAALTLTVARQVRTAHESYVVAWGQIRSLGVSVNEEWPDDCIVLTSYAPQVGYYSGCWAVATNAGDRIDQQIEGAIGTLEPLPRSFEVGYVFVEAGKRQPAAEDVERSDLLLQQRQFEHGEPGLRRRGYVWLQQVDRCVLESSC